MGSTTENSIILYRVTCTKAFVASVEIGSGYRVYPWGDDTSYYEGYDDGGHKYELPAGYCAGETQSGELGIFGPDNVMCHILGTANGPAIVGDYGDLITLRRAEV